MFYDKYKDTYDIDYQEVDLRSLLVNIRDRVHQGYILKTHPLSGSIKPKETQYKTVLMEKSQGTDYDSLLLIENAIITCDKFIDRNYFTEEIINDFKTIDLSLIESVIL